MLLLTYINYRFTMPPFFLKLSFSLYSYTSGWMSCLISFVQTSPSCEEREGSEKSKWKYMPPAGFEPATFQPVRMLTQRLRPFGHVYWNVELKLGFYRIAAYELNQHTFNITCANFASRTGLVSSLFSFLKIALSELLQMKCCLL